MRRASAAFLSSIFLLTACSDGSGSSSSTSKAKQFEVPEEAKGYKVSCHKARPLVKDRDEGIGLIQKFLTEPDMSDTTRAYYERKLRGFYVDRALTIAGNPSCFTVAQLEKAHRITDARNKPA